MEGLADLSPISRDMRARRTSTHPRRNPEIGLLEHLIGTSNYDGGRCGAIPLVNVYVALKSKPLVILFGPKNTGKKRAVERISYVLTAGNSAQCQKMEGHAWWATRTPNVSTFVQMQSRFISEKTFLLFEEAFHAISHRRVFTICMTRISPAELLGYFSEPPAKIQADQSNYYNSNDFQVPLTWLPNLLVMGTMDTPNFIWYDDENLLSQTTIIHWPGVDASRSDPAPDTALLPGSAFLDSCIRNVQAAHAKLRSLPGWRPNALRPLIEIESILLKNGVQLPAGKVIDETIVYLANAWSGNGMGLFDPDPIRNMSLAFDLAVSQIILPRGWEAIRRSNTLQEKLRALLDADFAHSRGFLARVRKETEIQRREYSS